MANGVRAVVLALVTLLVAACGASGSSAGPLSSAQASAIASAIVQFTPGPTAAVTPAATALTGSPICEPWLSLATVESLTGKKVTRIEADNYLNVGQPVSCEWWFADSSEVTLVVLDQGSYGGASDYFNPDGSLVEGAGEYVVTGLEGPGFYDTQDTMPSTIYWFPDDVNGIQMWTSPGLPNQTIPADTLIALARAVTMGPLPPKQ